MTSPWIAALIALFLWWFSTGAILVVVNRACQIGGRAFLWTTLWGVPFLMAGAVGLLWSLEANTVAGAYVGFLSALAIWGWFELAFLTGVVAGPNTRHCPETTHPLERFVRAWGTIAYSEMALIATLILIVVVSQGATNTVAMWTYVILFFARVSAKLNLYLGVPNINVEFIPAPMRHLSSHFRIAPMNWFFPIGVTLLSFAFVCWLERASSLPAGDPGVIRFALLAALTLLAIVEHWVMVLPIPDARLWRWMIPKGDREAPRSPERQVG